MSNSLLVISSYPPKGITHHKAVVGVATYTKNTLLSLIKATAFPLKITVLAEKLAESSDYEEEGIKVKRVWKRGSLLSQLSIFKWIFTSSDQSLLLELELAMLGGPLQLVTLPAILLLARIKGMKTYVIFHQVISSTKDIHGQLNLPQKSLKTSLFTLLFKLFYKTILAFTDKAIVFDTFLKEELIGITNKKNIVVIPHGIEELSFPDKKTARHQLGIPLSEKILLYFGYLAWYKGTDSLLESYSKIPQQKRPRLIIAGGPNPNHTNKSFYQKYVQELKIKAAELDVEITGFVDEKDIPVYFAASDICILPYRTFMSSSGPLSFVVSAQKPFLLSSSLSPVFQTDDLEKLLATYKIDPEKLIFRSDEDLQYKIELLLKNEKIQEDLTQLEKALRKERSWGTIGSKYYEEIFS